MARRLLHIRDLHVRFDVYGGTLKVLNGVNLHLDEGEKVGLVGETGCETGIAPLGEDRSPLVVRTRSAQPLTGLVGEKCEGVLVRIGGGERVEDHVSSEIQEKVGRDALCVAEGEAEAEHRSRWKLDLTVLHVEIERRDVDRAGSAV